MRIYISGPISGTMDAYERFDKAEIELREMFDDCDIINPERLDVVMPDDATHDEYMHICFELLKMADTIYMLNGWEKSSGACQEYGFAWAKDITILREEEKVNKTEWIPADYELPKNPNELVLVQCSGESKNVILDKAFELAQYDAECGWILEQFPWVDNVEVDAWMPLPEPWEDFK